MTDAIQGLLQSRLSVGAGRVTGGSVPTTPSARPSTRPGPKPFEQQDLYPVRRVTDVSDEAIEAYAISGDDDEGGYSGTAYPVTGAKPMDLTVTPFVRGTDRPEDVPEGVAPGFNTAYAGQLLEKAMGVNQYKYNPLTGRVEPDNLSAISLALPSPIGMAAGFGQAINRKNLQRIARMADSQEEGYALGMLQGRVVGVSPSPFGGYTLSGVLPQNLTVDQRQTIAEQLLGISQRSRTEFAKQQEERQRRVEASQASQEETDAGAGLFQPGDTPAQANPRYTPPPPVTYTADPGEDSAPAGNQYSFSSTPVEAPAAPSYSYTMYEPFARGGKADPVQGNGFVEGSPDNYTKAQTVADDENRQVREGSFVLNAPTTEKLQKAGVLPKGVDNPDKNSTIKANKGGLMDVALSKGEYVIEPEEAQQIGYSFLEQLNNQGKAEVDRRQTAADGGFIQGYAEGGELPLAKIELSDSTRNKFNTFLTSRRQRADVERLIDSMDDKERLAVLALAETTAATDPIESMMGVGQTAINRARTNRPSFAAVNDLASVMKQRSSRGSGSKMFQYDGLEPGILSKRLKEVVEGRVPGAVTKMFSAAENLLNPETESDPILPFDVMFYTKPDAPLAKDFEKNPKMRFFTNFGGHDYYALDAVPEGTGK